MTWGLYRRKDKDMLKSPYMENKNIYEPTCRDKSYTEQLKVKQRELLCRRRPHTGVNVGRCEMRLCAMIFN